MAASDFWGNKERAQTVIDETASVRNKVLPLAQLSQKVGDLEVLRDLAQEETNPESQSTAFKEVEKEYRSC